VDAVLLEGRIAMTAYKVTVEKAAVGHVAKAIAEDGTIMEVASGFGERDARRRLRAKINGSEPMNPGIPKRRKAKRSRKIHNPSGVIFCAKKTTQRTQAHG